MRGIYINIIKGICFIAVFFLGLVSVYALDKKEVEEALLEELRDEDSEMKAAIIREYKTLLEDESFIIEDDESAEVDISDMEEGRYEEADELLVGERKWRNEYEVLLKEGLTEEEAVQELQEKYRESGDIREYDMSTSEGRQKALEEFDRELEFGNLKEWGLEKETIEKIREDMERGDVEAAREEMERESTERYREMEVEEVEREMGREMNEQEREQFEQWKEQ